MPIKCSALLVVTLLVAQGVLAQPAVPLRNADGTVLTIPETDAYVERVFSKPEIPHFSAAVQGYLWILEQLDNPLSDADYNVLLHHLRPVLMVMLPSDPAWQDLDRAVHGDASPPGLGTVLVQWWRRQDPLPATPGNERLEEHLLRVTFATRKYADPEDVRGFDDRGEIYVRLGKPFRDRKIALDTPAIVSNPLFARLPDNEIWVYRQVHDQAHYLFIRQSRRKPFVLGNAVDLIPRELRNGRRKLPLLLGVLEEMFAQLALEHPHYGQAYDAIANYRTLPPIGSGSPHHFANRTIERIRIDDEHHYWRRQEVVPASFTRVLGRAETLQPAIRHARFLNADGTTRLELYWVLGPRAMKPRRRLVSALGRDGHAPSDEYLLSIHVARKLPDYQTLDIGSKNYLVPADIDRALDPRTFATTIDTSMRHVAVQWDQHWTKPGPDGALLPGATLKIGTHVIDSVATFQSDGRELEISDLKPLTLTSGEDMQDARPYPYAQLSASTSLAIYFEIYNLAFSPEDRTRYTIEYRVSSGDERRVGATSTYESDSRTAKEYIMLDLSTWERDGPLIVTVHARDNVTELSVERSIAFEYER